MKEGRKGRLFLLLPALVASPPPPPPPLHKKCSAHARRCCRNERGEEIAAAIVPFRECTEQVGRASGSGMGRENRENALQICGDRSTGLFGLYSFN